MNNVSNIAERRATQADTGRGNGKQAGLQLRSPRRSLGEELFIDFKPAQAPAEALETSLDEYRATMLDLEHEKSQFALKMRMAENTAQIRLEAAGYKALLAGVPENDIYALGEDMAEALSSAMNTVAGA